MTESAPHPDNAPHAPPGFRDTLAELVQVGMSVARMVGRMADAETALADAAAHSAVAADASPLATSLAEAIEADRAAAAAAEARQTVVARAAAVAAAFARTSRAIRLTIAQAERLDRGWAVGRIADDQPALAKRQIARGVADAMMREAEGERGVELTAALTGQLERLDTHSGLGNRSAEEIIAIICRDLRLDPVRMTLRPPPRGAAPLDETSAAIPRGRDGPAGDARPPRHAPDG